MKFSPILLVPALALTSLLVIAAPDPPPLRLLHLLDYIAVDYREAVAAGEVVDEHEYDEMLEFGAAAAELMAALPALDGRDRLVRDVHELGAAIGAKRDPDFVAAHARALRHRIIALYGVRTEPPAPPDPALGAQLYLQQCASCHGGRGRGDGPAAVALDPRPTDFTDRERMAGRTPFGLYSTITLGIDGTAMTAYGHLTEEQRWALAAHVSRFLEPRQEN